MKATFGEKVSPYAIEKIQLAKDQKVILGILSKTIMIAKVHFLPDIGYIHCFEDVCCEDNGIPGVRYAIPVVQYQTDGKITITSDELSWDKMLVLGPRDYNDLLTKNEILSLQNTDVFHRDILVTCTEQTYQNKTIDIMGESHWRRLVSKEEYVAHMQLFVTQADATFGRKVDVETYRKLMETAKAGPIEDRPKAGVGKMQTSAPALALKAPAGKTQVITKEDKIIDIGPDSVKESVIESEAFDELF